MERLQSQQSDRALQKMIAFTRGINKPVEVASDQATRLGILGKLCYQYYSSSDDRNRLPLLRASHGLLMEARSKMDPSRIRYAESTYYVGLIHLRIAGAYDIPLALNTATNFFEKAEEHPLMAGPSKERLLPSLRAARSQVSRLGTRLSGFNFGYSQNPQEYERDEKTGEIIEGEFDNPLYNPYDETSTKKGYWSEISGRSGNYDDRDCWGVYPPYFTPTEEDEEMDWEVDGLILPDDHLHRYLTPRCINIPLFLEWLKAYKLSLQQQGQTFGPWYITDRNLKTGAFVFKEAPF